MEFDFATWVSIRADASELLEATRSRVGLGSPLVSIRADASELLEAEGNCIR